MNPENKNEDEISLDRALRRWEVKGPLPPRFAEQVWRRIERAEARPGFWELVFGKISEFMLRPSVAVSYGTVLLATGLLAGYLQARVEKVRASESLGERYVQMMDPYQTRH